MAAMCALTISYTPVLATRSCGATTTFVDKLFDHNPWHCACFSARQFLPTYIHSNRALVALDIAMIGGGGSGPVEVTKKRHKAIGLIWKRVDDEHEFYGRLLNQAELQNWVVDTIAGYVRLRYTML